MARTVLRALVRAAASVSASLTAEALFLAAEQAEHAADHLAGVGTRLAFDPPVDFDALAAARAAHPAGKQLRAVSGAHR